MKNWNEERGAWPTAGDGEIPKSGGEKGSNLNATLHHGGRGLPKTSLSKLKKSINNKY